MGFIDKISERGYELQPVEAPFIKIKKFDELKIANIVIIFDKDLRALTGGVVAIAPLKTTGDIAHQYAIFRDFEEDIKYFSNATGYAII